MLTSSADAKIVSKALMSQATNCILKNSSPKQIEKRLGKYR